MDRRAAPPLQQQIEGELLALQETWICLCVLGDIPKSGKMFLEENLQDNKLATTTYTETETFMSENRSFYLDYSQSLKPDLQNF